ncbi:enoyl-CoA hydratase/isomerase family protein [Pseudomaricurvus alkylphenolicus]|uniref:enoyl-CoA hydratase-related protein n=1 Tax=Pseudomaricurvus alkylphenolicus TaxID=1306991 RepID=UPI00141FC0DB|nr:enoyl-CoA hydratase/isomerase family protein [Pseudomaricurvus alkylphenolicus]
MNGEYQTLKLEQQGTIASLTLNRPDKLNLIDGLAHDEVHHALEALKSNTELRAIVIAAEGKCFSAGGDFELMLEVNKSPQLNSNTARNAVGIIQALTHISVPVIAAVQGDAIGFGASLAFGCDIVVANRNARFADPHVLVGLAAGDGGCLFWPQAAGILRAKRYLLTGDYLQADKAYEFGLVTDLVDYAEDALPLANRIAEKIAALAPLAVQGTKRSLNTIMQHRAAEVVEQAALYEQQTMASGDLVEAVTAIQEKRSSVFDGT